MAFPAFMNGALADGTRTGDGPLPSPSSKRRRSTSLILRMDLLVGTLSLHRSGHRDHCSDDRDQLIAIALESVIGIPRNH